MRAYSLMEQRVAYIEYLPADRIPPSDQVPDDDNIIRIHGIHSRVMRHHYDLYIEVMRRPSPLSRRLREMIATVVSSVNGCRY